MRPADARRVLGVGPFADGHAIRKAYRRLALKYHPDKLRAQGDRARASAEREFLRVQAAHQLLTKGAEKASA
jgi:curved DNA-binding protein CbpA